MTVLLVSTNGVGLGHVTRTSAVARQLRSLGVTPVLVTMSPIVAELRGLGTLVEHIPSYRATGLPSWRWQRMLADQLRHLSAVYDASVVAFDGVSPYPGVREALADAGAPPYAWVRRGRWKPGTPPPDDRGFALVIEPGEDREAAASSAEQDSGRPSGPPTVAVGPVLLHGREDLLPPAEARARLGLPAGQERLVLVSLGVAGGGPLADAEHLVCTRLRARGVTPLVARSPLRQDAPSAPPGAIAVRHYPLAPMLSAVEAAIVAAGYNSVAEVVACGVPAVLVPSPAAATDDQAARAHAEADAGRAVVWEPGRGQGDLDTALDTVLDASSRSRLQAAMAATPAPAGARDAARLLADLAAGPAPTRSGAAAAATASAIAGSAPQRAPTPPRSGGQAGPHPRRADATAPGSGALVLALRAARGLYGVILRRAPQRLADRLRDAVARHRHRLPLPDGSTAGSAIALPGPREHPAVLLVVLGADDDRLAALRDEADALPVRPVWLTDTDAVGLLREHVLERVPPAADLGGDLPSFETVLAARIARLQARYRPSQTVVLPSDAGGGPSLTALLGGLGGAG